MSIDRLPNSSGPQGEPPVRRVAPATPGAKAASMSADQLALTRRSLAGERADNRAFSWSAALGHFGAGFKREAVDMLEGAFRHPLKTLALAAGTIALVALAPVILPVTSAAVGTAMALSFVGLGVYKAGSGAIAAVGDYRRGDMAKAEGDFETIGRGSFDVAAIAVPAGLARGASVLARTEAGGAVIDLVKSSAAGQAVGGALHAAEAMPGKVVGAQRFANFIGKVADAQQGLIDQARWVSLRGSATAQRIGGAFNFVFDNPALHRLIEADNAWAVKQIDQSPAGVFVRDWAIAHLHRAAGGVALVSAPPTSVSDKTGIGGASNASYKNLNSAQDFDKIAPGFRQKLIKDLEARGIKGYKPEDIVLGRKRLFQADVITEDRYAALGIKKVIVDGQPKIAVPTLDSPKPLLYDPGTKIIQKLVTDPDTGALILKNGVPQPLEIYGVPAKKFGGLYDARPDGHFIASDKRVIAIRATADGQLQTPWEAMDVKPGDAIMYPIDRTEGGFQLGAPYRHAGGQVLKDAYTLGQ